MLRIGRFAAVVGMVSCLALGSAARADVYLSEYVEGSSFNKAIEVFNGGPSGVNLSGWTVNFYFNGNTSPGTTLELDAAVLASGDVWVVSEDAADAAILAVADQPTTGTYFNGDDAVELVDPLGNTHDVIGQIGFDPGSQWGAGLTSTQDNTLRRMAAVTRGDSDGSDAFDPSVEWDGFAQDTFDGLGSHNGAVASGTIGTTMIAMQDFNSLDSSGTTNTDNFPAATVDAPLTNIGAAFTGPGDANHPGGVGMSFATTWTDSSGDNGPIDPPDSDDFIGVNAFTGSDAPNVAPDGTPVSAGTEHNFEFNDADGLVKLVFDPVDVSGFEDLGLTLKYWIADDSYENNDRLVVAVSDGTDTQILLNLDDDDLEANTSADNGTANWLMLNEAITLTGNMLTLTIAVDNNASGENIFIDDVAFKGTQIPEPASASLLAIGAIALLRRRRR